MREISVPPLVDVAPDSNITDLLLRQAAKATNPALFSRLDSAGQWQDIRATDFLADASLLAKGLMASGVAAGDRVGIMSRTRYEWALIDFAIWFAGAVSVPIYETSSPSQVAWNLGDSGAVAAFGETAHHEDIIRQAATTEALTALKNVWQLAATGLDGVAGGRRRHQRRGAGSTAQPGLPEGHRHDHLHLGHHRPAEGLRTDPRQLRGALRERAGHLAGKRRPRAGQDHHVPAPRPRLRPLHFGARGGRRSHRRAHPGRQEPAPGPAELQAHVHPRGAAGVREGLQLGADQGRGRRQGRHLPQGRGHRHRLLPRQAGRQAWAWA